MSKSRNETYEDLKQMLEKLKKHTFGSEHYKEALNDLRKFCDEDSLAKETVHMLSLGYGKADNLGATRLGSTAILLQGALGDITGAFNFSRNQATKATMESHQQGVQPNPAELNVAKNALMDHLLVKIDETILSNNNTPNPFKTTPRPY